MQTSLYRQLIPNQAKGGGHGVLWMTTSEGGNGTLIRNLHVRVLSDENKEIKM